MIFILSSTENVAKQTVSERCKVSKYYVPEGLKKCSFVFYFFPLFHHICSQYTLSLAPENIRKPLGRERVDWEQMGS